MTAQPANSMAALLSNVMSVVIWLAIAVGAIALIGFGLGLVTSLSGGELSVPGFGVYPEEIPPNQLALSFAILVIVLPIIVFVCVQLRRILATLAEGDPFVPDNASRLSWIAIAIAVLEITRSGGGLLARFWLDAAGGGPGVSYAAWASVIALLVLAQVFREGARLREEQKMTI